MRTVPARIDYDTRAYRDQDEDEVISLLRLALGEGPAGDRSPQFFRWKHIANPFGHSFMLVAEYGGRIVGLRAFMRWRFLGRGGPVRAVSAVDTATHPDFQGMGIFRRLTLETLEQLRGDADLVFNTPNDRSGPGYLKMGWTQVGAIPIEVRVRRPLRFMRGVRSLRGPAGPSGPSPDVRALAAGEVLSNEGLVSLVGGADTGDGRLRTDRSLEYLRWRYAMVPGLAYRAIVTTSGDGPDGLAIFRVRPRGTLWETSIAELLVRRGDIGAARRLLREVAAAARTDHSTCLFGARTAPARAARRAMFVRSPVRVTLMTNPLNASIEPDPTALSSWSFSLGDLEVF